MNANNATVTDSLTTSEVPCNPRITKRSVSMPKSGHKMNKVMKSAIGEGFTREDHPEVSNQLYAFYAQGKDTIAMKAVVGEEALSDDDKLFLQFLEKFEGEFLKQGPYDSRDIFRSLDICWDLLRLFPDKLLKKINKKNMDKFYRRKEARERNEKEKYDEAKGR